MGHRLWPLFDLRISTPRLELRLATGEEIADLCQVAKDIIPEGAVYPFMGDWATLESPAFERQFAQFHWRCMAEWQPARWSLPLTVFHDHQPIGTQGMLASDFATLRQVATGSWLGRSWQGRGIGKEMRSAVLHLAFAGLDAEMAQSGAREGNDASLAVSRALGYVDNGRHKTLMAGEGAIEIRVRLDRAVWERRHRDDITIEGLDQCREMFGI